MRLYYIDKMKALAMLLVVMGHTIYFCIWHEASFSDAVLNIICTFHVPLFFFLSGFVIKQPAGGIDVPCGIHAIKGAVNENQVANGRVVVKDKHTEVVSGFLMNFTRQFQNAGMMPCVL